MLDADFARKPPATKDRTACTTCMPDNGSQTDDPNILCQSQMCQHVVIKEAPVERKAYMRCT